MTVVINPNLVPTIAPGSIFASLTSDSTLNIRWLTNKDPAFYGVLNRPMADITMRQLIIAKATDQLNVSLGHSALYPFLIQPRITSGSGDVDVPLTWIWDINLSLPAKWENIRLAKIKRISGDNDGSGGYTGKLRLIFTGTQQGSSIETALFYCDYNIESQRTYQIVRATVVDSTEEATPIDSSESETISGFVTFKTIDTDNTTIQTFLDILEPPSDQSDLDSDGLYDTPSVYELTDAVPNDSSGDYSSTSISHGTGLLTISACNTIPALDSDIQSWVNSFNFPFDATANRTSTSSIVIPLGLFREFNVTAPAGDEPSGDTSGSYYPVWINRVERVGSTANQLRFYLATYNVTDSSQSTEEIEFASFDLTRDMSTGDIVEISPVTNLQLKEGSDASLWGQHLGRGHVVLSSLWGGTSSEVTDFFDEFALISDNPADTSFSKTATRLSSFGISRIPKYTPTIGQAQALIGSSARLESPIYPSSDNRYVTEADQGIGDTIDLEAETGITPNSAIERNGYSGALCHRAVKLIVNSTIVSDDDSTFYDDEILPRLRILFGRNPEFGDLWHNGTRVLFYNGDAWQSLG